MRGDASPRSGEVAPSTSRWRRVPVAITPEPVDDVEATLGRLDAALVQLNATFPRAAQVVQLRFIAGLTTDETAATLRLSAGTIKREWTFARGVAGRRT